MGVLRGSFYIREQIDRSKGMLKLSGMQTQHQIKIRVVIVRKHGQLGHIGCAKQTRVESFLIEKVGQADTVDIS